MSMFRFSPESAGVRSARLLMCLICLFMFLALQTMADDGQTNTAIARIETNFAGVRNRFENETTNTVVAWQFGRACYDMSTLQKDPSRQAKIAEQGIAACRLSLRSNSVQAHYYLGMDLSQLADAKHNFSALHLAKDIEREFLAARALDEHFDYAGPDRNLGLLYRETPTIISIGSRTKARQHLEEAVKLAPDLPENRLNLLESYIRWGYHTEATRELKELERIWPAATKTFTGDEWALSWWEWNKRLAGVQKKLEEAPKPSESPHAAP